MKKSPFLPILVAVASTLFLTACGGGHDEHDGHDHSGHDHAAHEKKPETKPEGAAAPAAPAETAAATSKLPAGVKPYPLDVCLVEGDKLDASAFSFVHQGQEVKFCCDGCLPEFKKDPAKYLAKLQGK